MLRKVFPTGALPPPLAKRALRHTLLGLAQMHRCGVVHTDATAITDMVYVQKLTRAYRPQRGQHHAGLGGTSKQDLDILLRKQPPCRHPPEPSWGKQVEVTMSQPLFIPSPGEALALFPHRGLWEW
jgi:hypothetical protein